MASSNKKKQDALVDVRAKQIIESTKNATTLWEVITQQQTLPQSLSVIIKQLDTIQQTPVSMLDDSIKLLLALETFTLGGNVGVPSGVDVNKNLKTISYKDMRLILQIKEILLRFIDTREKLNAQAKITIGGLRPLLEGFQDLILRNTQGAAKNRMTAGVRELILQLINERAIADKNIEDVDFIDLQGAEQTKTTLRGLMKKDDEERKVD